MNNKHYIGKRVSSLELYDSIGPITAVALLLDDENEIVVGDESGYTLEVSCPYGTKAMANNLLSALSGKTYKGFRAENAILTPTAELGDGVTLSGEYHLLAHRIVTFGPGHMSEIEAPGENTLEHEYQWKSPEQKEFDRKIAQTRSLISKTAEEIQLLVEGLDGKYTKLSQTVDGFTFEDESGTVYIDGGAIKAGSVTADQIDATNLKVAAANITGTLSASQVQIDLTGSITWADLSNDVQNEINDAYSVANAAQTAASNAEDTVDGWRYGSTTYIDSSMIKVTTLMATELLGGSVGLLTAAEREAGGIEITGSSSSTYAVELYSNGSLRLVGNNGDVYMEAGTASVQLDENLDRVMIKSSTRGITVSDQVWVTGHFLPLEPNYYLCGNANYPWSGVWSTNGMCETSDRNKKKDITYGLDRMDGFFDGLRPSEYRMKNGTSGRKHFGFVAQDVKDNLDEHDIPTTDFAGYVEDKDENGNPVYALRYSEFIALLVDQVQKLKARVAALEGN